MSDGEQRWTIRVEGDLLEIGLHPSESLWRWLVPVLVLPLRLGAALIGACVGLGFLDFGMEGGAGAIACVPIGVLILAAMAFVAVNSLVTTLQHLSWSWTGFERTTVRPDTVRIEREGVGIRAVVTVPRRAGSWPHVGLRPPLPGNILHFGLPRPGRAGLLGVHTSGERDARFGLDLTRDEAKAIAAEIQLIRSASEGPGGTT